MRLWPLVRLPVACCLLPVACSLAACGGSKPTTGPKAATQGLPPANPLAVQRMVEGVTAARDPKMRERDIADLRLYNAEIHPALFALPNFYRELLPA